jgi:hypothetical protein
MKMSIFVNYYVVVHILVVDMVNACHVCHIVVNILMIDIVSVTCIAILVCSHDKYFVDCHVTIHILVVNVISMM